MKKEGDTKFGTIKKVNYPPRNNLRNSSIGKSEGKSNIYLSQNFSSAIEPAPVTKGSIQNIEIKKDKKESKGNISKMMNKVESVKMYKEERYEDDFEKMADQKSEKTINELAKVENNNFDNIKSDNLDSIQEKAKNAEIIKKDENNNNYQEESGIMGKNQREEIEKKKQVKNDSKEDIFKLGNSEEMPKKNVISEIEQDKTSIPLSEIKKEESPELKEEKLLEGTGEKNKSLVDIPKVPHIDNNAEISSVMKTKEETKVDASSIKIDDQLNSSPKPVEVDKAEKIVTSEKGLNNAPDNIEIKGLSTVI